MQAKLTTTELAYLLHTHGANSVLGLDDATFFPQDENVRRTLQSDGFAALQKNGWLVPEGNAFHTNSTMMLLAAVLAAPEWVLVVGRIVENGAGQQLLTYSVAQEYLVEQFQADDGEYVLTRIEDKEILLNRLYNTFRTLETHSFTDSVSVEATIFGEVPRESTTEAIEFWGEKLPVHSDTLARRFSQLQRHGRLRTYILKDGQPGMTLELAIVQDSQGELWSIAEGISGKVTLSPLTTTKMAELLMGKFPGSIK